MRIFELRMMKALLFSILLLCTTELVQAVAPNAGDQHRRGSRVYISYCRRCHGADGRGIDGYRNIRDREVLRGDSNALVVTIAFGATGRDPAKATGIRATMPAFPFRDQDLADVASYVAYMMAGRTLQLSTTDVRAIKDAYQDEALRRMRASKK